MPYLTTTEFEFIAIGIIDIEFRDQPTGEPMVREATAFINHLIRHLERFDLIFDGSFSFEYTLQTGSLTLIAEPGINSRRPLASYGTEGEVVGQNIIFQLQDILAHFRESRTLPNPPVIQEPINTSGIHLRTASASTVQYTHRTDPAQYAARLDLLRQNRMQLGVPGDWI